MVKPMAAWYMFFVDAGSNKFVSSLICTLKSKQKKTKNPKTFKT